MSGDSCAVIFANRLDYRGTRRTMLCKVQWVQERLSQLLDPETLKYS